MRQTQLSEFIRITSLQLLNKVKFAVEGPLYLPCHFVQMHLALDVTLLARTERVPNRSNHAIGVLLVGLLSAHQYAISVESVPHQLLHRRCLTARRYRTQYVQVYQVARRLRERHVDVHRHELSLMRILRYECVLLNVRLHVLVNLEHPQHHYRSQRQHRDQATDHCRLRVLWRYLTEIV